MCLLSLLPCALGLGPLFHTANANHHEANTVCGVCAEKATVTGDTKRLSVATNIKSLESCETLVPSDPTADESPCTSRASLIVHYPSDSKPRTAFSSLFLRAREILGSLRSGNSALGNIMATQEAAGIVVKKEFTLGVTQELPIEGQRVPSFTITTTTTVTSENGGVIGSLGFCEGSGVRR